MSVAEKVENRDVLQVWSDNIERNNLKAAEEALRKALKLKPGHSEYTRYLSETRHRQGAVGEAIEQAVEAVRLAPEDHDAYNQLASLHYRNGNLTEASTAVEAALQRSPENLWSLLTMSAVALRRGDIHKAHAFADRAIAKAPLDPNTFVARADAHLAVNELDYAEAALAEAVKLASDNVYLAQKVDYLRAVRRSQKSDDAN